MLVGGEQLRPAWELELALPLPLVPPTRESRGRICSSGMVVFDVCLGQVVVMAASAAAKSVVEPHELTLLLLHTAKRASDTCDSEYSTLLDSTLTRQARRSEALCDVSEMAALC